MMTAKCFQGTRTALFIEQIRGCCRALRLMADLWVTTGRG